MRLVVYLTCNSFFACLFKIEPLTGTSYHLHIMIPLITFVLLRLIILFLFPLDVYTSAFYIKKNVGRKLDAC